MFAIAIVWLHCSLSLRNITLVDEAVIDLVVTQLVVAGCCWFDLWLGQSVFSKKFSVG